LSQALTSLLLRTTRCIKAPPSPAPAEPAAPEAPLRRGLLALRRGLRQQQAGGGGGGASSLAAAIANAVRAGDSDAAARAIGAAAAQGQVQSLSQAISQALAAGKCGPASGPALRMDTVQPPSLPTLPAVNLTLHTWKPSRSPPTRAPALPRRQRQRCRQGAVPGGLAGRQQHVGHRRGGGDRDVRGAAGQGAGQVHLLSSARLLWGPVSVLPRCLPRFQRMHSPQPLASRAPQVPAASDLANALNKGDASSVASSLANSYEGGWGACGGGRGGVWNPAWWQRLACPGCASPLRARLMHRSPLLALPPPSRLRHLGGAQQQRNADGRVVRRRRRGARRGRRGVRPRGR
jgi:hypothetical protein